MPTGYCGAGWDEALPVLDQQRHEIVLGSLVVPNGFPALERCLGVTNGGQRLRAGPLLRPVVVRDVALLLRILP